MNKLNLQDVTHYVEQNIGIFHQKRLQSLSVLKLSNVLKRKNPYLFKAKHILTAEQIIRGIVDAHISSSEEGIFGDWLEGLVCFSISTPSSTTVSSFSLHPLLPPLLLLTDGVLQFQTDAG